MSAVVICDECGRVVKRLDAHNRVARAVEAAAKQSVTDCNRLGNAAKMREALDSIYNKLETLDVEEDSYADEVISSVKSDIVAALSAPPRNCDIGTTEEHIERHIKFCKGYKCGPGTSCYVCFAKWSQMPYEEGGAE